MIIKDKPFPWICAYSCQPVLCWHHLAPAVLVSSSGSCRFEPLRFVRFHRLQAYQLRLSRYLVMRRSDVIFDRQSDAHFDALLEDYLDAGRAGGGL